jgi:hypothetical protein
MSPEPGAVGVEGGPMAIRTLSPACLGLGGTLRAGPGVARPGRSVERQRFQSRGKACLTPPASVRRHPRMDQDEEETGDLSDVRQAVPGSIPGSGHRFRNVPVPDPAGTGLGRNPPTPTIQT